MSSLRETIAEKPKPAKSILIYMNKTSEYWRAFSLINKETKSLRLFLEYYHFHLIRCIIQVLIKQSSNKLRINVLLYSTLSYPFYSSGTEMVYSSESPIL